MDMDSKAEDFVRPSCTFLTWSKFQVNVSQITQMNSPQKKFMDKLFLMCFYKVYVRKQEFLENYLKTLHIAKDTTE